MVAAMRPVECPAVGLLMKPVLEYTVGCRKHPEITSWAIVCIDGRWYWYGSVTQLIREFSSAYELRHNPSLKPPPFTSIHPDLDEDDGW